MERIEGASTVAVMYWELELINVLSKEREI